MVREVQGNPCYQHDLMMMMMGTVYRNIFTNSFFRIVYFSPEFVRGFYFVVNLEIQNLYLYSAVGIGVKYVTSVFFEY